MLVLSRQRDEHVIATVPNTVPDETLQGWIERGTDIPVDELLEALADVQIDATIVDIRGDKVRMGFAAPKWVTIHRGEVQAAIEREGRSRLYLRALRRFCAAWSDHVLASQGATRRATELRDVLRVRSIGSSEVRESDGPLMAQVFATFGMPRSTQPHDRALAGLYRAWERHARKQPQPAEAATG